MKNLIIIIALILTNINYAQIVVKENTETTVFTSSTDNVKLFKYDTTYYSLMYKNEEYTYINDYGFIHFKDTSEIKTFFNYALEVISTGTKVTLSMDRQNITLSKFGNTITIMPNKGYFTMPKSQINKLIESL
jgi:hypothetical protein